MSQFASVLAFDLGASSGRALIGEMRPSPEGEMKLSVKELHRFPNYAVQVGSHLHWDILYLLKEIKYAIKKAFQEGYTPRTFGVDTWGVDFGLLDANGELIGLPYHYRDPHTEGLIEELNEKIGGNVLFKQSGLQFMMFNTLYQLYAMVKAKSPKFEIAQTLLLTPDLLVYLLTDQKVCEFTMATTTALYNPTTQSWNKELMQTLGIPKHLFVDAIQPGTIIGPLSKLVCEELDVPAVDAVAVCTHDTESAVAAVPSVESEFAYLVCGTWSLLGTEMDRPLLTEETLDLQFSNEGGADHTYQLLKNIMGLWILQECKREWDEADKVYSYAELVQLAEQALPFRSLINPDDDRFYSPQDMVLKIGQFCSETNQPVPQTVGQIVRCILESLALRYRQALEQAEHLIGSQFTGLHMVGGGIQNELLCKFTASAIGRVVWAGPIEASAIGNIMMQYIATGVCKNLLEARQLVASSFPIKSYQPQKVEEWSQAYWTFNQLN